MDKANNNSSTPLITAIAKGRLEVCRYLLEQGANRDKANNKDWTPLHYAASYGHLDIAMLLIRYGADLNARNIFGQLPIDMNGHLIAEKIKQAIRDEPRRRMDEAPGKRATEQDRHPNIDTSASTQQEVVGEVEQMNNRSHRKEGPVTEKETKVAEEDEDSEPSSDEEVDD